VPRPATIAQETDRSCRNDDGVDYTTLHPGMSNVLQRPPTSANKPRHIVAAIVMGAIAALTLFVNQSTAADAYWYPLFGTNATVSPVDSPGLQFVWPKVGMAIGLFPVWLAGIAVVLLVFVLGRRLGSTTLGATAAALGLAVSTSFWARASTEQPAIYALLYSLAATGGLLLWRDTRRRLPLLVASLSYALAVAGHPAALGALPALIWVAGSGGIRSVMAMMSGAAAGVTGLWLIIGGEASPADWFVPEVIVEAGDRLGLVAGLLMADFGILGLTFLTLGILRLTARPHRFVLLAGGAAGMVAWALVWSAPAWRGSLLLAFAPLWLVAASGMELLGSLAKTRATRTGAAILIGGLPIMNMAAHFDVGARAEAASAFTDRYIEQLRTVLPAGALILAEGGLLDRRLATHAVRRPDRAFARIPQTPRELVRALQESRPVVGFASARENLRALGFRFETIDSAGVLMSVPEFIASVPDGWIVAVAAGPEFFQSVLPEARATFASLGGTQDLFGRSKGHYGLIGVKGARNVRAERSDRNAVELRVRAAEPLDSYVRSPVALRVRGFDQGAIVEYRGRVVASSGTGIALAVISPSGVLEAVYDDGLGRDRKVLVNPRTLRPGVLTGREPCVEAQPEVWTDVSNIASRASIGALTAPRQNLAIYVAGDHPLSPHQAVLRRPTGPALAVRAFDTSLTSDLTTLRRLLGSDGLAATAPQFLAQAFVYRIRVRAAPTGRQQLALRLAGFATLAFARVAGGSPGAPLNICSAMSAEVGSDVDLERSDLFVFGWDAVEGAETTRFRWTTEPHAEMLLPMARPEALTLAFDAWPLVAGTTLEVRVNETLLAPVRLESARREYRWDVPAESWRTGMNQVWLNVSKLARPSDLDGGRDDRLLGLAVAHIRLITGKPVRAVFQR